MKKIFVFLLCACVLLCSCTPTGVYNEVTGSITNPDTGIEYTIVSNGKAVFVRSGWNTDVYMKDSDGNEYYTIHDLDPEEYICDYEKYDTEEIAHVYRATDAEEITVEEFDPTGAQIWVEGYSSQLLADLVPEEQYLDIYFSAEDIEEIRMQREAERLAAQEAGVTYYADYDYVYAIRDTILNDEVKLDSAPSYDEMDSDNIYHIRLLSNKYQGLYYDVVFWRDNNGTNYLLDRGTNCSYLCPFFVAEYFIG